MLDTNRLDTDRLEQFARDGLVRVPRAIDPATTLADVVLAHPLTVHRVAPNCGERPRVMRIARPRATPVSALSPQPSALSPEP